MAKEVKARWDFGGEQATDLAFKKGDILIVLDDSHEGWWKGRHKITGKEGNFPANFVKPVKKKKGKGSKQTGQQAHSSRPASDRSSTGRQRMSIRSSFKCIGVAVVSASRQRVEAEGGHLRTFYAIELATATGKKSFMKRYHEVCNLDSQLRAFFPDLPFAVNLRSPELNRNKRQIDVITARKEAIEKYLTALLHEPNVMSLMLGWLVPGEKLQVGVGSDGAVSASPSPAAASSRDPEVAVDPSLYPAAAAASFTRSPGFIPGTQRAFSFGDSLDAFDDLMEKQFSVLSSEGGSGTRPQLGQMVEVAYSALVWDGANDVATEFESAASHVFQLGDFSIIEVPPGLHRALLELGEGCSATLVLGPDAGFGLAGLKPHVPELAHLVYHLTFTRISGPPDASVRHILPADRDGDAPVRMSVSAAPGSGGPSMEELEARFAGAIDGTSKRASFVPMAARKKQDVVMKASSSLAAVTEEPASPSAAAGAGVGSGAGSRGHRSASSGAPHPMMGNLGREVAMRASSRDFSHVANSDSRPRGSSSDAPRAPVPTGHMTVDQAKAAKGSPGVNAKALEALLKPTEFQRAFGVSAEEFYTLPEFKRQALKRQVGLF